LWKKIAARGSFFEEKTSLRDMMKSYIFYLPSENEFPYDAGTDLHILILSIKLQILNNK
jgi:hypothetical protein